MNISASASAFSARRSGSGRCWSGRADALARRERVRCQCSRKEIDDKTFGKGFDCFTEDAVCNLGVADWHGREAIRENLRAFIDTGFTALHNVVEYWDGGSLKVFRGIVTMTPDDRGKPVVKPVMTHFFYMDEADPTKVRHWFRAVGPVGF
jgi:hypothetical protein